MSPVEVPGVTGGQNDPGHPAGRGSPLMAMAELRPSVYACPRAAHVLLCLCLGLSPRCGRQCETGAQHRQTLGPPVPAGLDPQHMETPPT